MPTLPISILQANNRRTTRGPVNPLDKCTIVSIFPKKIKERHATIYPGLFEINSGTFDDPAFLIVGPSSWWKNVDQDDTAQPLLEIPTSSPQIAQAVIRHYCNGLIAATKEAMPGLFFLLGDHSVRTKEGKILVPDTKEKLKKDFSKELLEAKSKQDKWWHQLVDLADALWVESNGHTLSVDGFMRMAAEHLGIRGKDWMVNTENKNSIRCVACGALRNPAFPVCGSCHAVVDKEKAAALGLTFAK